MQRRRDPHRVRISMLALTALVLVVLALTLWPVRDFNCAYPNTAAIVICTQSAAGIVMDDQAVIAKLVLGVVLGGGVALAAIPRRRSGTPDL